MFEVILISLGGGPRSLRVHMFCTFLCSYEFLSVSVTDDGTPTLTLKILNSDSNSDPQNQTPTPTLGLIVWHDDCVLKDDLREIFNSSNKKCAIVYKHTFGCKINCTKVKYRLQQNYTHKSRWNRQGPESESLSNDSDSLPLLQCIGLPGKTYIIQQIWW